MPPTLRRAYVDLAYGQLHYRYAGEPDRPCLLLLHQSPSHSAMFDRLMRQLAGAFYLLAPDLPGFGQSDPLPDAASVPAYARAIHGLLQAVGVGRCGVFGHHTGAAVAVALVAMAPDGVDRLALSGPPLLSPELRRSLPERALSPPLSEDGAHLVAMWQRMRAKDPQADLGLSQRELLSAFGCGSSYRDSYAAVAAYDFAGALAQVRCPALVFAGSEDSLHGAVAPTLDRLERGESVAITGGGASYVCEREADQVAAALREFFTGRRDPALDDTAIG